ncbi:hypothetical protein KIW84_010406 [Lathyrus oleraceus]|uniref:Uncharacterized protein n=1 Tax=Pisum sativum TaxID=3888 RepID=A0A9D4YNY3_PEA|nr:hypothetical protein KIW84_010406 [Pisum sativum]
MVPLTSIPATIADQSHVTSPPVNSAPVNSAPVHTSTPLQSPIGCPHPTSPLAEPNSAYILALASTEASTSIPLRVSNRIKRPPSYLQDYHCNNISRCTNQNSTSIAYPLSSVLTYNHCSPAYKLFCCSISSNIEPKNYNQASKFDCWKEAMNAEIAALEVHPLRK